MHAPYPYKLPTIGATIPAHNGQTIGAPIQWRTDARAHKRKNPDMPGILLKLAEA